MISFFVPGKPVAQQRPRAFRRGERVGVYQPKVCAEYKNLVKMVATEAQDSWPIISGPVYISMTFYMQRPNSVSKKRRPYPTVKPDIDNLYKGVADALEWILYEADQQVVRALIDKRYADDGQKPGVAVVVTELKPQEGNDEM